MERTTHNDPTPPTPPAVTTPKSTPIDNMPIKLSNQMSKFDIIPVIEEREEMVLLLKSNYKFIMRNHKNESISTYFS